MSGGLRIRAIAVGAAVLLSAAGAVVLAAPGASAANNMALSVNITSQTAAGTNCNWAVTFDVTITNSGSGPITVTSVDVGSYDPLSSNGGLAAGTVLQPGTNTFTGLASSSGPSEGGAPPCPVEAPAPLVLTVGTAAGTMTWNESVSDPQVVTMAAVPSSASAILSGSFDVADCAKYFFEYGTTTNYGNKVDTSTADCPNAGTATEIVTFNVTGLQPGTVYHYRFVVMSKMNTVFHGQDVQFTTGTTTVPIGSIGVIGLAALAGCALFITQRLRRRSRQSA